MPPMVPRKRRFLTVVVTSLAVMLTVPLSARQAGPSRPHTSPAPQMQPAAPGVHPDASQVGAWSAPADLGVIAIHSALLHTGKVLAWWYPLGDAVNSPARLFDPKTKDIKDVTIPFAGDFFCSGHTILSDGRVLVTGGLLGNPHPHVLDKGHPLTAIFDPASETWSQGASMNRSRWYPTDIALPDGKVLTLTGKDENALITLNMEMYDPAANTFSLLPPRANVPRQNDTYVKMKVLTNGKIFMAGSGAKTYTFDPTTNTWSLTATMNFGDRYHGAAVIMPDLNKVFVAGGTHDHSGGGATGTAEIIDLSAQTPLWTFVNPMHMPRYHANLVILADGTFLEVGGAQTSRYGTPVQVPELYDPATDTWTEMATQTNPRTYHSTALLLPDGSVWSAGSDDPANDASGHTYEIFSPPYLFKGLRPTITAAPTSITYNQKFTVVTPSVGNISKVALIRPASTTHDNDFDQRYVVMNFIRANGKISVAAPPDANHAPPGWYMLVLVGTNGVPSIMPFLQLQ